MSDQAVERRLGAVAVEDDIQIVAGECAPSDAEWETKIARSAQAAPAWWRRETPPAIPAAACNDRCGIVAGDDFGDGVGEIEAAVRADVAFDDRRFGSCHRRRSARADERPPARSRVGDEQQMNRPVDGRCSAADG